MLLFGWFFPLPCLRAPGRGVPGDTAKEQAAKPQHDPIFNSKTIYTQLPHAVTCCSRLKMAKFYRQMHKWNSTPVLSLIKEHGLPRMTPGLPALWHFSRTSVIHQCRVEKSVHYPSSDQKCEDFQGSFQIIYGAKYEQDCRALPIARILPSPNRRTWVVDYAQAQCFGKHVSKRRFPLVRAESGSSTKVSPRFHYAQAQGFQSLFENTVQKTWVCACANLFFFPASALWPVWPGQSTVSVGRKLYRSI